MKNGIVGMPEKDTVLRRWGGRLVLWVVLAYAALVAFSLVVFRVQIRSINDAVCVFNKHILNPAMMALDRRYWYAAVLRHKGRHSGKEYAGDSTSLPTMPCWRTLQAALLLDCSRLWSSQRNKKM